MTSTGSQSAAPSGNQKRKMKSAARLYAVQALFQMEQRNQSMDFVVAEFLNHRFGAVYDDVEMIEGDASLFQKLIVDAVNHQASIDQMTDRALVAKWPIARIDPTPASAVPQRRGRAERGGHAAESGDLRVRGRGAGLLPRWQGAQVRQRRAGPHGARGPTRSLLILFDRQIEGPALTAVIGHPKRFSVEFQRSGICP